MTLADYLIAVEKSAADFAKEVGVTPVSMHRYLRGARVPKKAIMQRICLATAGLVTANDFILDTEGGAAA